MKVRPKTRKATLRRCAPDAPTAGRFKIERMRALFPSYDRSRPNLLPTEGLLRLAKMKAVVIMSERAEIAEGIFRAHAVRHYRVKPHQVTFDQRCLRRIRNARLSMTISSELVGETALDEEGQIWISGYSAMSFERLVGTLIHESLHGWCRVRGKCMPISREHTCMERLGDFCAEDWTTSVRIRNATADVPMTVSYFDVQSNRTCTIDTIRPRSISTVNAPAGSELNVRSAGSLDAPPQLLRTIVVEDIERQEEVVGKGKSEHLIRPQSRPPSPGTFSVDL